VRGDQDPVFNTPNLVGPVIVVAVGVIRWVWLDAHLRLPYEHLAWAYRCGAGC
jgi:hypothetical protein